MRSSQFNRKPKAEEFQPQQPYIMKRRFNWGIVIYSLIVLVFLVFVGRFLADRFLYVEARGQVLYKKLDIQLPADAQLIDIYKEEGEAVRSGDTLFRYAWSTNFNSNTEGLSGFSGLSKERISKEWLQKELLSVQKTIERLKIQLESYRERLAHYRDREDKIREGIYLNVYTAKALDGVLKSINKLRAKIRANRSEIKKLESYKDQLNSKSENYKNKMDALTGQGFRLNQDTLKKYSNFYVTPIDGNLTQIYKESFEVALKSEKIMTIHKKQRVIVRAFFDQDDLKYIEKGDEVSIRFPDGSNSRGRIQQLYFSTHVLPKAFRKKGQPFNRKIAADIKPLDGEEVKEWRSFYKMSVVITKQMLKL